MTIVLDDVTQGYGSSIILSDISLHFDEGEVVALVGPNGSGKSTMIRTICGIMPPKKGKVVINGQDLSSVNYSDLSTKVSYVPQTSTNTSQMTVLESVLLGRKPYVTSSSFSDSDVDVAVACLERMGLYELSDRNTSQLSGGQMQRVNLARALAQDPRFYILDEPTSALDLNHQIQVMKVMNDVVSEKDSGAIVALHDLNLALNYSDRVVMISGGRVYADGKPRDVITEESIKDVYSVDCKMVDNENGRYVLPFMGAPKGGAHRSSLSVMSSKTVSTSV